MPSKLCKTCKEIKEYELFPKQRTTSTGRGSQCKNCVAIRNRKRYEEKKESLLEKTRAHKAKNKEIYLIRGREYSKKAYRKNKALRTHISRRYQCNKAKRVPAWLTPDDHWIIKEIYSLAALRTQMLGFEWQVDHVIPLQGKTVSGLHVPTNLQVIPMEENCRKGNRF